MTQRISVVMPSLPGYDEMNEKCMDSYKEMYENIQPVVVIENGTFAENVNLGVKQATEDIILIVNNDTTALPSWGEWVVEATKYGIASLTPRADCGWGFAISKELWEKVGQLDENLENSYEDYDFFIRAALLGYTRILPKHIYAIHSGGHTLNTLWGNLYEQRPERLQACFKNRDYMKNKWPGVNMDAVPSMYWAIHGISIMKEWQNVKQNCSEA